jgi:hypothetical protein
LLTAQLAEALPTIRVTIDNECVGFGHRTLTPRRPEGMRISASRTENPPRAARVLNIARLPFFNTLIRDAI